MLLYLKEACDDMDVRPGGGHKHARCQAGVHVLQVQLGGARSAADYTQVEDDGHTHTQYQITADYSGLTYIWENLKRASMLMLRSNTSIVAAGEESLKRSKVKCSRQVLTGDNQQRYKVLCYTTIKGLVRRWNFLSTWLNNTVKYQPTMMQTVLTGADSDSNTR